MLRKISLSLLAMTSFAAAADVSFSGVLNADMESNFNPAWEQINSANQDLTLTTRVQFDEKTAVELRVSNYSTIRNPLDTTQRIPTIVRGIDFKREAPISDSLSRWGDMHFDGIQFQWEFSRMAKLLVGDMIYSAGQANYYGYSWAHEYGAIMKETRLRGIGFNLQDQGQVYLGMPDANDRAIWGYASYSIPLINHTDEKLSLRPVGDFVFKNGGRENRWNFGTEGQGSIAYGNLNMAGNLSFDVRPFNNTYTYQWLAEPSLNYKRFSLGGTYYQAFLARTDSAITLQTDIPEEQFCYIEPIISLHPKFSMGLSGEWHNPSSAVKNDEYYMSSPTFYLFPSEKMTFTFWQRNRWQANDGHYYFGLGTEAQVKF